VLQSQQQERRLWQLWLWQDHVWCGGGDERVLGDDGVLMLRGRGRLMMWLVLWLMVWWMVWRMVKT
jgi:hypothetical protein